MKFSSILAVSVPNFIQNSKEFITCWFIWVQAYSCSCSLSAILVDEEVVQRGDTVVVNCGSEIIPGPAREGIFCGYIVSFILIFRLLRMNLRHLNWDCLTNVHHLLKFHAFCFLNFQGYFRLFCVITRLLLMVFDICVCASKWCRVFDL